MLEIKNIVNREITGIPKKEDCSNATTNGSL